MRIYQFLHLKDDKLKKKKKKKRKGIRIKKRIKIKAANKNNIKRNNKRILEFWKLTFTYTSV